MKYVPLLFLVGCFGASAEVSGDAGVSVDAATRLSLVGRGEVRVDVAGQPAPEPRDSEDEDAGTETALVDAGTDAALSTIEDAGADAALAADAGTDSGPQLGGQCASCASNTDCLSGYVCDPVDLICAWKLVSGHCSDRPGGQFLVYKTSSPATRCVPNPSTVFDCAGWCVETGLCN